MGYTTTQFDDGYKLDLERIKLTEAGSINRMTDKWNLHVQSIPEVPRCSGQTVKDHHLYALLVNFLEASG